ncbi:nucleotide triphosphate diphosphatase NUDT15 [Pseudoalteromonas xiamenensis]
MNDKQVRVGVAVVIVRHGRILLGERIGAHGAHTWATPGGHLEFGESIAECAIREVAEETGLIVKEVTELGFSNDVFDSDSKHYVTVFVHAEVSEGQEAQILEPHKCLQWVWYELDALPSALFLSLKNFMSKSSDVITNLM